MLKNRILILMIGLTAAFTARAQQANVQIIHNSGDFFLETVDVYLGDTVLVDSMMYRTSTPFMQLPAGQDLVFTIQSPSLPDTNASLHSDTFNLDANGSYVMVMLGLVSPAPYDSSKPVELVPHSVRSMAAQSGNTDVLFFHGVPDMGELDIEANSGGLMVDSLGYGNYSDYKEFTPGDYELEAINSRTTQIIAEYAAPMQTWGLGDSAIVILSSGFSDTLKDEPGDSVETVVPKFRLFAALPSGGNLMPLPILSDIDIENFAAPDMKLYPIPADKQLFIRSASPLTSTEARIYDLNGKLLHQTTLTGQGKRYRLDLQKLDRGFYLIELKDGSGKSLTRKIMVR